MIERKRAKRAVTKRTMHLVHGKRHVEEPKGLFTAEEARELLRGARGLDDLIERMLDRVVERVGSAESRDFLRFLMETDPGLLEVLELELCRASRRPFPHS